MPWKFTLKRECLNNVDDAAGRFQIEGGSVLDAKGGRAGNYSSVKRVSCGTQPQNTAQLWLTLFLLGKEKPVPNITLHGAHDFNSGAQSGSVSAATGAYNASVGKPFKVVGDILTID